MNISTESIRSFTGGIFLFRFPCHEMGPDLYYLFKFRIVFIDVDETGLSLIIKDIYPNRFSCGEWTKHPTQEGIKLFKSEKVTWRGEEKIFPLFVLLQEGIVRIHLDGNADAVIYSNEKDVPDELHIFRHFESGYETLLGLNQIQ